MTKPRFFLALLGLIQLILAGELKAQQTTLPTTQSLRIGDINFTIPSGFQLEQVAGQSLTTWPIIADWDAAGRLIVVESGGVSKPIVEHNKQLLHRVVRLEDENADGIFDKRTVVAKDLPFMEGVLCVGTDFLVSAPPNIYRLIDQNHDGICESREVWFDGQTVTGCANDLHGPYLGRDGWIYWCKGAFAEQHHDLLNGQKLSTTAAHIFRRRLAGGPIEPVMTGGMDNPVEVAITPEGERFFTSTFLHHPGQGLRDGIAHAVYGAVFGKDQRVLQGHPRTGPLMPVLVELGAAAPSGLICLESSQMLLPADSAQRTLVAALFNLQKVVAHRLQPVGASFATAHQDLVVADRIDFHPTDILEDADGSLLIIDTGGWYDLCCPTSRVDQKTASGGIYRLSPAGRSASTVVDRGEAIAASSMTPAGLAKSLIDKRPWIARGAKLRLLELTASQSQAYVSELERLAKDKLQALDDRLAFQWALCAIASEDSLAAIESQLWSDEAALIQAACHALALHRFAPAKAGLEALLGHASSQVRRAAAEALGRIGDLSSARALLASLETTTHDRHLQHSVTYALIELAAADAAAEFLAAGKSDVQKQAAMTALEQLGASERLSVEVMLAALQSPLASCRAAASEILSKHPQWAPDYQVAINDLFRRHVLSDAVDDSQMTSLFTIVDGWQATETVHQLVRQWLEQAASASLPRQRRVVSMLARFANTTLDASWSTALAAWLAQAEPDLQSQLTSALAEMNLAQAPELQARLLELAKSGANPELQLQFLAALPRGTALDDVPLERRLIAALSDDDPQMGQAALGALQRVKLSGDGGKQLLMRLKNQPPRTLAISVEAIQRVGDDELDLAMLAELTDVAAARSLSPEQLTNLYRQRDKRLQSAVQQTLAALTRPPGDVEKKVDEMLARLRPGDPIRGLQLFRSNKTACSGCHRLGYVGGEIGPELTRIGSSRTRRALLEAILFPSARLEQSYQPWKVLTHDGQVYNGLITKHLSPREFVLQMTVDKSLVLNTDDVARQEASEISVMPAGMAELLTPEELSDLLAILESAR